MRPVCSLCVAFVALCTVLVWAESVERRAAVPAVIVEHMQQQEKPDFVREAYSELKRISELQVRLEENVARIASFVQERSVDRGSDTRIGNGAVEEEPESPEIKSASSFTSMIIDDLVDVRLNLANVGKNLNHTMHEIQAAGEALKRQEETIEELKEHEQELKVREAIRGGQVAVDYETGKIDISSLKQAEENNARGEFLQLLSEADPAMLHLDIFLLQDIVVLCLAASFLGAVAISMNLPIVFGYLAAGMIVGPSCLGVIQKVVQVETLAQFGSMFILFSRGLTYSSFSLALRTTRLEQPGPGVQKYMQLAATVAVLFGLILCVLWTCVVMIMGMTLNFTEALITAFCFSLPATSWVVECMLRSSVQGSTFSHVVLEFCRVLDLAMAAMLVAPAIVRHLFLSFSFVEMIRLAVLELLGFLSMWIISRAIFPLLLSFLVPSRLSDSQVHHTYFPESEPEATHAHSGRAPLSPALHRMFDISKPSILLSAPTTPRAIPSSPITNQHAPDAALFAVVAYCTGLSMLTEWMELSADAGALFAGLVLMDGSLIQQATAYVEPLTSFFGGLYLASIGMITSPLFLLENIVTICGWVSTILLLKFVVGYFSFRNAFEFETGKCVAVSAGLCNISEVGVFVCARAHRLGLTSRKTYLLTIASIVFCFAFAPPLSQRVLSKEFHHSPTRACDHSSFDGIAGHKVDSDSKHRRKNNKSFIV